MSAGRVVALQLDKLRGSAAAQCGKALPYRYVFNTSGGYASDS
jgi:hypothetical protein